MYMYVLINSRATNKQFSYSYTTQNRYGYKHCDVPGILFSSELSISDLILLANSFMCSKSLSPIATRSLLEYTVLSLRRDASIKLVIK